MGKPYSSELQKIESIGQWTDEAEIESLIRFVGRASQQPLITIGSGGSLTAAAFASLLHEDFGQLSIRYTPLEFVRTTRLMPEVSILLLTAGGRNPDILQAFRHSAESEAAQVLALCTRTGSSINQLCQNYHFTEVIEYKLPSGKDGFLATNSLVATLCILTRAYQAIIEGAKESKLNLPIGDWFSTELDLQESQLGGDKFLVLYGGWSSPAALDLESKIHEAGLGVVQLADYRNFAHGRHYGLANSPDTIVIALATADEQDLARRTVGLLPKGLNMLEIYSSARGPAAAIELIVHVLRVIGLMGEARNVDPGKPTVPSYGRKIYRLEALKSYPLEGRCVPSKGVAVRRKLQPLGLSPNQIDESTNIVDSYDQFIDKLGGTIFGGLVFDYDGTLISQENRYRSLSPEVIAELTTVLELGLVVGIATGRGKSVRDSLQESINKKYWNQVQIGYYNGGAIGDLEQDQVPSRAEVVGPGLEEIFEELSKTEVIRSLATITPRFPQITVEPISSENWKRVREGLLECVSRVQNPVKIVESSHSIDVIGQGVSKLRLVDHCRRLCKDKRLAENILCIGDKGKYPGNDCELLSSEFSLSVDAVSSSLSSCWNIAPPGFKGVQATIHYLKSLKQENNGMRLILPNHKGSKVCVTH